jgi:hypothetical protein
MRIKQLVVLGAALTIGLVMMASNAGSVGPATVLKADTLAGVTGPYVGSANPIRGVNGGGIPWDIAEGKAVLSADGHLVVKVEGLVLATTGTNPVTTFRGLVSCQTIVDGAAAVVNVPTDAFPASTAGESRKSSTSRTATSTRSPIVRSPCIPVPRSLRELPTRRTGAAAADEAHEHDERGPREDRRDPGHALVVRRDHFRQ